LTSSRFRRFAVVSLAGNVFAAMAVVALYHYVALQNFETIRAEQNTELARSLSNTIIGDVVELGNLAATSSWADLKASPEVARFAASIERETDQLNIFEINVFDPNGLVLYSTDKEHIGAKMLMNEGVERAAAGEEVSAIIRHDSFNQFDRVVEDRDMVESYIPLIDESGTVIGVFEIHSDVTGFFDRLLETQRTVLIGVGMALLFLYSLLLAWFWRSDRKLFVGDAPMPRSWRRNSGTDTANRAKSEFVATISHEIRTPLNAVLGMTDLLNLTNLTRKQREYSQTIQSSGDMLISLIDNLLDFAHLESGALELQKSEFDVMDLVERVLHIMGHSASAKGLELIGDIQHELDLRVASDKRRLQQILINIVSNAIKFTETGEVVLEVNAFEVSEKELRLRFTISDTGPGIDEQTRESLFAAFASGNRPASSQKYGSGLGLTICKRLLDNMGGSIEIESREQGGTEVAFEVPVGRASSPISGDLSAHPDGGPQRVFSMFANDALQKSVCRLLDHWDMQCEKAADVEEGLRRLRASASSNKPFDCVIVDSAITPEDHLQIVRRIRKNPETADLPVILLTSISKPLGVGEVSALGHLGCLNKPLLPLELRFKLLQATRDEFTYGPGEETAIEDRPEVNDLRVLIAEDNPVSSGVLHNMLRSEGFEADVVEDGPSVLEALQARDYDLLLLDCQMPGMDGDVVTQNIRKDPERYGNDPVVVAITADTTEQHRQKCIAAGMDDFMPKPVRLEGLRSGLARWVSMSAARGDAEDQSAFADMRRSLVERTGYSDESFITNYIGLFLEDTGERLDRMSEAFAHGDSDSVRREGHALKGACLELGADRMVRYCEDLSVSANRDNMDEMELVLGKLSREFDRLRPVYESVQVSSTSPS
jgi:signal transduction histidine kinase/CheY-like chemotaxis protein/HPt (histidine-containing phosphotransfer) domain-containing protein